jgi:cell division transport system permease protein
MSYKLETVLRIVKLGLNNFWRNRWLTLGATLLMTLTLTMISVFLLFSFIVRDTAEAIRSKIDVTIYFTDDAVADEKIMALADRIKSQPNIQEVIFVNKKQALEIWQRLPINEDVKKPVSDSYNPLPRSLQVDTTDPDEIQGVVSSIEIADTEKLICNECVSYVKNKDAVNKLVSITRLVQRVGLFLSIFFGIIAIFNVLNIIRITISARSDEIEIMRYVGASNAFVRGPFIVEGVLYGVLGTIITTLFIVLVSQIASGYISITADVLNLSFGAYVLHYIWQIIGFQLLIGVILGVVVSVISMRRYLRA